MLLIEGNIGLVMLLHIAGSLFAVGFGCSGLLPSIVEVLVVSSFVFESIALFKHEMQLYMSIIEHLISSMTFSSHESSSLFKFEFFLVSLTFLFADLIILKTATLGENNGV